MEKFPPFIYNVDAKAAFYIPGRPPVYYMPTKEDGRWEYRNVIPRHLDESMVEKWKTTFYELEGWDPGDGWQTRATLESLGLTEVARELESAEKIPY